MNKTLLTLLFLFVLVSFCLSEQESDIKSYYLNEIISKGPRIVGVDKENIYIINYDNMAIYVYSEKDVKFKFKFGKKGQGPGEFIWINSFYSFKNRIFISNSGRAEYFDKQGKLIKEIRHHPKYTGLIPIGENYVCSVYGMPKPKDADKTTGFHYYSLLNAKMEEFKKVLKIKTQVLNAYDFKKNKHILFFLTNSVKCQVYNNRIYVGKSYDDKEEYHVFNQEGDKIKTIVKRIKKRKSLSGLKEHILNWYRETRKKLVKSKRYIFKFNEYFPSIFDFFIDNEKIYVVKYPENKNTIPIFVRDLDGNLLKEKRIKLKNAFDFTWRRNLYIYGNKLYFIEEDENKEVWVLMKIDF